MRVKLLAIIRNLLGDTIRICMREDREYYLQDGYKLYKMKYDNGNDDNEGFKFDLIDFLNKATYEGEATLTHNQLIQLLTNTPISDAENLLKQPASG